MGPLDDPRLVATFHSVAEAELACAHLTGAGIPARLEGQHSVGVLPMHAIALGGVRVVVGVADLERARELLSATSEAIDERTELSSGDDENESSTPGDPWMRQAAFAGFLGYCLCPLVGTLYSIILLVRYGALPTTTRGTVHRRMAAALNGLALLLFGLWRVGLLRKT